MKPIKTDKPATKAKPKVVKAPKATMKKASKAKTTASTATEISLASGTYYLHDLMVSLGFPGFAQDYARLLEKGIVKVNGETVTEDAEYDVNATGIDIEMDGKQYRVVGVEPEPLPESAEVKYYDLGDSVGRLNEDGSFTNLKLVDGVQVTSNIEGEDLSKLTEITKAEAYSRVF